MDRRGEGFSLGEIKRAGLAFCEAKRLETRIDKRRRTVHLKNVQVLKEHFMTFIPLLKIKGIGKAAGEELESADILNAYDSAHADINALTDKIPYPRKTLKRWGGEAKKY